MEQKRPTARQTYPLAALFVLVAACGVVTSLVTPAARSVMEGKLGVDEAAAASGAGTLIVMLVGGIVGLYHYRPVRGLMWGLLTGAAIGVVIGPVALSPAKDFPSLMSMSLFGGVILVGVGAAFGLFARLGGKVGEDEQPRW